MRVTIVDIAKEAGVSKSTVSLVINNSENVKLATRYKVQQAIDKLGYVPNFAARELTTSRSHTLGMIFFTSNHLQKPYAFSSVTETLFYDISNSIYSALKDTNYTLLVERFSLTGNLDSMPYLIKSRRLCGVFLIGGLFTSDFINELEKYDLPIVIIGRKYEGLDSVSVDAEEVGSMGITYLLKQKFKKIAFINGPESSVNSQQKLAGVENALRSSGLPSDTVETIFSSSYSGQEGYEAFSKLWNSGFHPDAVFGASDGITSGIMRFLYNQNIRVPDEISVLGYEDSLLSEYSSPALTVVNAHKEIMGEEACKMMIKRIKKPRAKIMELIIPPSLIIRDSVRSK